MLKTTIEDAGSENDTQSQKEAFQQIRREIATSSDITEQQQLQIIHDEEAERQKEEERITNQEEQMERMHFGGFQQPDAHPQCFASLSTLSPDGQVQRYA